MGVVLIENYVTEKSGLLPVMEDLRKAIVKARVNFVSTIREIRNNDTIVYNTCVNVYYTFLCVYNM